MTDIYISGRKIGKSTLSQFWNATELLAKVPKYVDLTSAEVDGRRWYSISCNKEVAEWVKQQPKDQWQPFLFDRHNAFDVHEELYVMLKLKWV
jgi:hypothetical protein